MAKFCTGCGTPMGDDALFCTNCGTKVPEPAGEFEVAPEETVAAVEEPATEETAVEEVAVEEPVAEEPVVEESSPKPESIPAPTPTPTPAPAPAPEQKKTKRERLEEEPEPRDKKYRPVSTGTYFGLMFVFGIPVIGWLICLIMSFAPKNKSLKHFASATMIWILIGLVLAVGIGALLYALISTAFQQFINAMEALQIDFDDLRSIGDLIDLIESGKLTELLEHLQKADLGSIADQVQSGELGDVVDQVKDQVQNGNLDGIADQVQNALATENAG